MFTDISNRRDLSRLLGLAGAGLVALAACGSGGGGGGQAQSPAAPPATTPAAQSAIGTTRTTLRVTTVGGRHIVESAAGHVLYVNDQDNGSIACTSSACTSVWIPLTVGAGQQPSAPEPAIGKLGTVHRPDGTPQVTLDGRPLYTFSFDHAAGQVTGDGAKDSFDGTDFVWHAATAGGAAPASSPSSGGGYQYP